MAFRPSSMRLILESDARMDAAASRAEIPLASLIRRKLVPSRMRKTVGPSEESGTPADLPDVVYVENLASALYLDKPAEVERYLLAMERLSIMAHDPQRTTEILDEIIKDLEAARDE